MKRLLPLALVSALSAAPTTMSLAAPPAATGSTQPGAAAAAPPVVAPAAPAKAAGGTPTATPGQYDCVIDPSRVVELGSPVVGVLDKVMVDRGDTLKRDQVVAQLAAHIERAALASAESRAAAVGAEAESAKAAKYFATRKSDRSISLYEKEYLSAQAKEQDTTEAAMASMRHNQASSQLRNAQDEVELARTRLAERTIRSPITGVVVERYLQPGERVEDKPILKIATTDPLRVDVVVPASDFFRFKLGAQANVFPDGVFKKEYLASVTQVDKVMDPASNTFRVRLTLPNPGNTLPGGLRCKLALRPDLEPVPVAALKAEEARQEARLPAHAKTQANAETKATKGGVQVPPSAIKATADAATSAKAAGFTGDVGPTSANVPVPIKPAADKPAIDKPAVKPATKAQADAPGFDPAKVEAARAALARIEATRGEAGRMTQHGASRAMAGDPKTDSKADLKADLKADPKAEPKVDAKAERAERARLEAAKADQVRAEKLRAEIARLEQARAAAAKPPAAASDIGQVKAERPASRGDAIPDSRPASARPDAGMDPSRSRRSSDIGLDVPLPAPKLGPQSRAKPAGDGLPDDFAAVRAQARATRTADEPRRGAYQSVMPGEVLLPDQRPTMTAYRPGNTRVLADSDQGVPDTSGPTLNLYSRK